MVGQQQCVQNQLIVLLPLHCALLLVGDSVCVQGSPPKYGYISTTPGTQLRIKVNSTSSSKQSSAEGAVVAVAGQELVSIELAHLKSYFGMGQATVSGDLR